MTDIVAPLTWTMNLDSTGFEVAATRAGQTLKSLSGSFVDAASSAMKTDAAINKVGMSFKDTIVTMGAFKFLLMDLDSVLLSFPKSVAKIGGEFQKMQVQMQGLSKSSDELVQKVEGMRDVAFVVDISKDAPIELKKLTDTFVKFKEAGIDPANGSMQSLINSVAKFGGGSDVLDRAGLALREMMGTNVVNMKELRRQLGQAIPNAMQLMAKGLGLTMEELTKKVTSGTLLSTAAVARLFQMMAIDAQGAAEKMMHTFPGALSRMTTEYHLFEKAVSDRGFLTDLASAFTEITAMMDSPGGHKFAKDIGESLRDTVEMLILAGRWAANNTENLKMMGAALISIYGGGKLGVMINGIKSSFAAQRESLERVRAIKQAAADKDISDAQRVANTDARLQGQAERTRDAYQKKLGLQREKEIKDADKAVASEVENQKRIDKSHETLLGRRVALEQNAEKQRLSAIDSAKEKIKASGEKINGLNDQWYSKVNVADAGLASDQVADEAKRLASVDKISSRREASLERLRDLEQRKDDAIQRHKEQGEEKLLRSTERREVAEGKLNDKTIAAEEKIVALEQKRAQVAESAHNSTISRLEKEGRVGQAQLDGLQKKIKIAGDGSLSESQKTEQLEGFRKVETEKRLAHENELKRIGEVRERRELIQREQIEAINKLDERQQAGPQRNEQGRFVKGNSKADLLEAGKVVATENAQRQVLISTLNQEETAHLANARALSEEGKQAAKSGDALARRTTGVGPNNAAMQQDAAARQAKLFENQAMVAKLRAMSSEDIAGGGAAAARVAPIDAQIKALRTLIATYEESAKGAVREAEISAVAAEKRAVDTVALDRQIIAQSKKIELETGELERLNRLTVSQGRYTAAVAESIAVTERKIASSIKEDGEMRAHLATLEATTAATNHATEANERKIAAAGKLAADSSVNVAMLQKEADAIRALPPATNDHIRALESAAIATGKTAAESKGLVTGLNEIAPVAIKAGSALAGLGRSLVTGGLYAAAFYAAIEAGMWIFDKFTEKARTAEAAILAVARAKTGQSIAEDDDKIGKQLMGQTKQLEDNLKKIEEAKERLAVYQKPAKWNDFVTSDINSDDREKGIKRETALIEKNVAANILLREGILSNTKARNAAKETIQLNRDESDVNSIMGKARKSVDAQMAKTSIEENQKNTNNELYEAESADKPDAKLISVIRKRYENQVKARSTTIRVMTEQMGKKILEDNAESSDSVKASLRSAINAWNKAMRDAERDVHRDPFTEPKKEVAPPTKSAMATALENQAIEIVKQEAEMRTWDEKTRTLAGIHTSAVAEYQERIAKDDLMGGARLSDRAQVTDKDGKKKNVDVVPNKERGDEWVRNAEAIEVNKLVIKEHKELEPLLASMRAMENHYADVMNGDALIKEPKGLAAANKMIEDLTRYKEVLGTPAGDALKKSFDAATLAIFNTGATFEESMKRLRNIPYDEAIFEETQALIKKTGGVKDKESKKNVKRMEEATALVIKQERDRVNILIRGMDETGHLSELEMMHREDLLKELTLFEEQEKEKLAKSTRSAVAQMAVEWSRGYDALEKMSVKWLDKFVDDIFAGKLKFKDFIKTIIEDTGKIKFKEMMSGNIGVAFDGATDAMADLFGIKGGIRGRGEEGKEKQRGFDAAKNAQRVLIANDDWDRILNRKGAESSGAPSVADEWDKITNARAALTAPVKNADGAVSKYEQISKMFKDAKSGFDDVTTKAKGIFDTVKTSFGEVSTKAGTIFDNAGNSLRGIFEGLKSGLSNMIDNIANAMSGGSGGGLGSLFSSGSTGSSSSSAIESAYQLSGYANGGIMTSMGNMSLRKYANGGVATSPQLALFGEGSMNEAYVPLPDGRRIPVALSGGAQQGQPAPAPEPQIAAPSVHINLINQSGQQQNATTGNIKFDGRQMILDVVLSAAGTPGAFRDNFRGIVNQK